MFVALDDQVVPLAPNLLVSLLASPVAQKLVLCLVDLVVPLATNLFVSLLVSPVAPKLVVSLVDLVLFVPHCHLNFFQFHDSHHQVHIDSLCQSRNASFLKETNNKGWTNQILVAKKIDPTKWSFSEKNEN